MKANHKIITIMVVTLTAMTFTMSCNDDLSSESPRFGKGGIHGLAVGVQNQWTAETRAENSNVTLLMPDQLVSSEPLVVIIEDELTGDTAVSSYMQTSPTTRGKRYTSEEDDDSETGRAWDGTSDEQHYMHDSFALFGMTYSSDFSFSTAELWDGMQSGSTPYTVLTRPTSPEEVEDDDNHLYEIWDWGDLKETEWPTEGSIKLFALAPAPADGYGVGITTVLHEAPVIEYNVPTEPSLQQDLMIAEREMTSSKIAQTIDPTQSNPDVTLDFQHICTAVKFKLALDETDTGNESTKITSITMKNVVTSATFTFDNNDIEKNSRRDLTDNWTWDTSNPQKGDMTFSFGEEGVEWTDEYKHVKETMLTPDDNVFMMIPQEFTEGDELEVDINFLDKDGKPATLYTRIKHAWKAGHTVVYTIAKAGAIEIGDPVLDVTAIYNTDNTARTPTSVTNNTSGITTERSYTIAWDAASSEYVRADDIAFNVESYRPYKYGSNDWKYAHIPWSIEQTELKETISSSNADQTYTAKDLLFPEMIEMSQSTTAPIPHPVTGVEEEKTVKLSWGDGGQGESADKLPFVVNRSKHRGIFQGDAMQNVFERNPIGTSDAHQDLSMLRYDGTPMDAQNTANCYVIGAAGYYSIPIVYGNAIVNGQTYEDAYKMHTGSKTDYSLEEFVDHTGVNTIQGPWISDYYTPDNACIVWSTSKDLITEISLSTDNKYINFRVDPMNINLGNAVLAVRDASNNILWSWHLWVTDYSEVSPVTQVKFESNPSYEFMEVNLGWTDAFSEEFKDSVCAVNFKQKGTDNTFTVNILRENYTKDVPSTGGTYYQNGRKDPFPGSALNMTKPKIEIYPLGSDNSNLAGGKMYVYDHDDMMANEDGKYLFNQLSGWPEVSSPGEGTIGNGIANPGVLYRPATDGINWFDGYYDNLWTMQPHILTETDARYNMDEDVYKTIYDPCPAGFCIPNPGAFRAFYQFTDPIDFSYDYYLDDPSNVVINGIDGNENTNDGYVEGLRTNNCDIPRNSYQYPDVNSMIAGMKSDLKTYGYTVNDPKLDEEPPHEKKGIVSTGKFASARNMEWKVDHTGASTNGTPNCTDSRFDGVEGLYNGHFFLPAVGYRNPEMNGKTEVGEYQTYNYGGYYATAFSAPQIKPSGEIDFDVKSNLNAASFFWIQRKRMDDNDGNVIVTWPEVPLFDPYKHELSDEPLKSANYHNIWIYREAYTTGYVRWTSEILHINLNVPIDDRDKNASAIWGNTDVNSRVADVIGVPKVVNGTYTDSEGKTRRNGVFVYFKKKSGPLPYSPQEWGRKRYLALSVRPVRDKIFATKADVGIRISNSGGSPYRDTRSRLRK